MHALYINVWVRFPLKKWIFKNKNIISYILKSLQKILEKVKLRRKYILRKCDTKMHKCNAKSWISYSWASPKVLERPLPCVLKGFEVKICYRLSFFGKVIASALISVRSFPTSPAVYTLISTCRSCLRKEWPCFRWKERQVLYQCINGRLCVPNVLP